MEMTPRGSAPSISMPIEPARGSAEARRAALKLAVALGFVERDLARVALVVAEAASNIVQHAGRGEILLRAILVEKPAAVEILALDQGQGIANVAQALRDGYSTKGTAGLGLGNISRASTCFGMTSTPGKGTALLARVASGGPAAAFQPGMEWGVACVAKRDEQVCGDSWAVTAGANETTLLLVDGLGHGLPAFEAAREVVGAFWQQTAAGPAALLQAIHLITQKSRVNRGAVAAIAAIDWQRRELRYAGAGNISGVVVTPEGRSSSLVSHSGTIGESVSRFQEFKVAWPDRAVVIFNSDGLSSGWDLDSYPGLSRKHPSLIAGVLYRDFVNRRDDVLVLVGRERDEATQRREGDAG